MVTAALTIPNGDLNNVVWAVVGDDSGGSGNVTGCMWNGNPMTQVATFSPASFNPGTAVFFYVFYIAAGTGDGAAHNVVATRTSAVRKMSIAVTSYSGAGQTGIVDNATSSTTGSATSLTSTLTPVAANCWAILFGGTNNGGQSAGTGTTLRTDGTATNDWGLSIFDSNGIVSGSTSLQQNLGSTTSGAQVMVSMAPFTASSASRRRALLGVGQ